MKCSASDTFDNTANGSFTVTIEDTTAPAVTVPADIAVEATSPNGAAVTFDASANDIVDGATAVTCTPASGATFALGTTAVACSSTDAHGNTATGGFNVTVGDTTAPAIAGVTPSQTTLWPPNKEMTPISFVVDATDAVTSAPVCRIIGVASNEPRPGEWQITGALTLALEADRSGSGSGRVYTI